MNRIKYYTGISLLAVFALLLSAPAACADEKGKKEENEVKVAVKDLPKPIVDAVMSARPGGTIVEADKEEKNGKTVYEVDVTQGGKKYEVKVDDSGKVLSNKEDDEKDEKDEKK